jgi:hypothetical protein
MDGSNNDHRKHRRAGAGETKQLSGRVIHIQARSGLPARTTSIACTAPATHGRRCAAADGDATPAARLAHRCAAASAPIPRPKPCTHRFAGAASSWWWSLLRCSGRHRSGARTGRAGQELGQVSGGSPRRHSRYHLGSVVNRGRDGMAVFRILEGRARPSPPPSTASAPRLAVRDTSSRTSPQGARR